MMGSIVRRAGLLLAVSGLLVVTSGCTGLGAFALCFVTDGCEPTYDLFRVGGVNEGDPCEDSEDCAVNTQDLVCDVVDETDGEGGRCVYADNQGLGTCGGDAYALLPARGGSDIVLFDGSYEGYEDGFVGQMAVRGDVLAVGSLDLIEDGELLLTTAYIDEPHLVDDFAVTQVGDIDDGTPVYEISFDAVPAIVLAPVRGSFDAVAASLRVNDTASNRTCLDGDTVDVNTILGGQ